MSLEFDGETREFFIDASISIGGKIRKYRELRGLTQHDLGIKCGFAPSTATVRISQFELGKKLPQKKIMKAIGDALDIDYNMFFDNSFLHDASFIYALRDMEETFGLHPVKKADGYYLAFSGLESLLSDELELNDFLREWYEIRQNCKPDSDDKAKSVTAKSQEYDLWWGQAKKNVLDKNDSRTKDLMRKKALQTEIDILNAKLNKDTEFAKINEVINEHMATIQATCKNIEEKDDLRILINDIINKGLNIEVLLEADSMELDTDDWHLLSVKTKDILEKEENKLLFTELVFALDTFQKGKFELFRKITSLNNELYITYYCNYRMYKKYIGSEIFFLKK